MLAQLLWKAFSHATINAQILFVHKYPPLSVTKYSFTQQSEQEQYRQDDPVQGLTRQHQGSNPGSGRGSATLATVPQHSTVPD